MIILFYPTKLTMNISNNFGQNQNSLLELSNFLGVYLQLIYLQKTPCFYHYLYWFAYLLSISKHSSSLLLRVSLSLSLCLAAGELRIGAPGGFWERVGAVKWGLGSLEVGIQWFDLERVSIWPLILFKRIFLFHFVWMWSFNWFWLVVVCYSCAFKSVMGKNKFFFF